MKAAWRALRVFWNWLTPQQRKAFVAVVLAVPLTALLSGASRSTSDISAWIGRLYAEWPYGMLDVLVNSVIVFGLLSLILRASAWVSSRDKSGTLPIEESQSVQYRLLDDAAVTADGEDALGRADFVRKLSRTVVLPRNARSLVLALEAEWGAGKSSVVSLLIRELKDHPDRPLVVQFNPWLATGQNRIFRAFFSQFSASLLDRGERELASELVQFGETLEELLPSGARVFPRVGLQRVRRLTGKIPVIDLEGQKDHLSESVRNFARPIVVIVDDIDRLPPDDIRAMFQLIKAVAAFPRVTYLLAFDPHPVDQALRFGRMHKGGSEFREKIVQANIPLPRVSYGARKSFFEKMLFERLAAWRVALTHWEQQRLLRAIPLALSALRTPRDMKRTINRAMLVAENIHGEVNFADVLVFETLHSKFPKVGDLVRQNPRVVHPMGISDEGATEDQIAVMVREEIAGRKDGNERMRQFLKMYPRHAAEVEALLTFLFPTFFEKEADAGSAAERRLDDHETLLKFVYQGLHGELLSAQDAVAFLTDENERAGRLADAIESSSLGGWLDHLTKHVAVTTPAAPERLFREIALAVNRVYTKSRIDTVAEARRFMTAVAMTVEEPARTEAAKALVADIETAAVGEGLLLGLFSDAGLWAGGKYLGLANLRSGAPRQGKWQDVVHLDSLKEVWLAAIRALGAKRLLEIYPNALGSLFRWGQFDEPEYAEVRGALERAFEDRKLRVHFMLRFPPGIGLPGVDKLLTPTALERLERALDEPEVPTHIRERFAEFFQDQKRRRE